MKWLDLVGYAAQDIGVLIPGERLDAKNIAVAQGYLTLLLGTWATDQLLVPNYKTYSHSVSESKNIFSLGGGDSDIDLEGNRILSVRNVRLKSVGCPYYYGLSYTGWTEMQNNQRAIAESPSTFYWQNSYPISYLWFDTIPFVGDEFEVSFKSSVIGGEINLDDDTGLPVEYENAIRYALAEELLGPYGISSGNIMKLVMARAETSRRQLRALNLDDLQMNEDQTNLFYRPANYM